MSSEIGTLLRFPESEAPEAGDHCSYSETVGSDIMGSTLESTSEGVDDDDDDDDDDETSLDGIRPIECPSVLNKGAVQGER